MARLPDKQEKAGGKEASGFMEGAFSNISSALWMLAYVLVFAVEMVLVVASLITGAISLALGVLAAIAGAVAGIAAKIAGLCSDLRDEVKESWLNWKAKKDRIAAQAKKLEAMEA